MPNPSVDALAKVPLLSALDEADLRDLAGRFGVHRFERGSAVIRQGERGPRVLAFFVIAQGRASVRVDGEERAVLEPGDHFGEISLFRDVPRTATVEALDDLSCFALSAWDFGSFVRERPELGWRLCETLAARLAENEAAAAGASRD